VNPLPALDDSALDARQRDALGVVHDRLRHLSVAVVGCGGVGSPLAEQLWRMGVGELMLVDHDPLDTPSNVRRVFGSSMVDLAATAPPAKVDVVGRHLDRLGLGKPVRRIAGDARTEPVFRQLLDADVVIAATDTHGSRAVLNDLPSAYFLPVIDVGTRVDAKRDGALSGLFAEVRVLTPATPCLWCRGTISGDVILAENLPDAERRRREREGHVVGGVGEPIPSVVALTVLGAGLAACALLALLADGGRVAPIGYVIDGFLGDARETEPKAPVPGCRCREVLGRGDAVG
jgi:molybdopterin/thiamine biosynthesis adenylyltransferase